MGREVTDNFSCQNLVYFFVARNRLRGSGSGIVVDVVFSTVSEQLAAEFLNPLDQNPSLHPTSISSILLIPGRSCVLNS